MKCKYCGSKIAHEKDYRQIILKDVLIEAILFCFIILFFMYVLEVDTEAYRKDAEQCSEILNNPYRIFFEKTNQTNNSINSINSINSSKK